MPEIVQTEAELRQRILRSLCANTPEELEHANQNYNRTLLDHLATEATTQEFVKLLQRSFITGGPPTTQTLYEKSLLGGNTDVSLYVEELQTYPMEWGSNYTARLEQYLTLKGENALTELIQEAAQILQEGRQIGREEPKKGFKDTIEHLITGVTRIQSDSMAKKRFMTNSEAVEMLITDYSHKKNNPNIAYGIPTGHEIIDDATRGGQYGELWVVGGFASQGKTTFALNWASQAALGIGFNVAIFSQEMPKEQIWRILGTIHSSHPKWEDRKPLLYEQVKSATLSPEDEVWLMNTLIPDLRNPEHGKIIVYDPLPNPTIDEIRVTAETINRTDPLDMMIIDYIGLLNASPSKKKMQATAGAVINENLKAAKQMALDFNEGQKILVVTPHQINRKGFESAQKSNGVYEFSALSDANEAERSADVVITVFADDPLKQRHEAVGTMLKNRDGRVVQPWNLFYSPEHRIMGNIRAAGEISYQDVVDA